MYVYCAWPSVWDLAEASSREQQTGPTVLIIVTVIITIFLVMAPIQQRGRCRMIHCLQPFMYNMFQFRFLICERQRSLSQMASTPQDVVRCSSVFRGWLLYALE